MDQLHPTLECGISGQQLTATLQHGLRSVHPVDRGFGKGAGEPKYDIPRPAPEVQHMTGIPYISRPRPPFGWDIRDEDVLSLSEEELDAALDAIERDAFTVAAENLRNAADLSAFRCRGMLAKLEFKK